MACERELEYDIPGATPRLVVNSLICQDSLMRFEVSVSASPGSDASLRSLKDARITLWEDLDIVEDFVVDSIFATPVDFEGNTQASVAPIKLFFHQTIETKARSGRLYSLEVKYNGLSTVTATAIVPRPTRARTIPQPFNESIFVDGKPLDRLVFEIDDNGNANNHYGIEIMAQKAGGHEAPERIMFFSDEKPFTENLLNSQVQSDKGVYYRPEYGVFFSNGKFRGLREQFEVYVDPAYLSPTYTLKLRLLTLSNDYFEFATSYQKQRENSSNPFAEPTQVYSNITAGLGIFAGYAVTQVDF